MKVLLIILGVLLLIGLIPVGVVFRYRETAQLRLVIAFFHKQLLPKKPKTRKQLEKEKAKKEAKAAKKAEKKKKKEASGLIAKPPEPPKPKKPLRDRILDLLPWAKLGVRFVREFFGHRLCIRRLMIRAALAGDDPAKLAAQNGKAWEAIGIVVPVLEQAFRIKQKKIAVYPDFTASKTDLEAEVAIRLRVGGVVWMLLRYACKALGVLIRSKASGKKRRKDGADGEKSEKPELPAGNSPAEASA